MSWDERVDVTSLTRPVLPFACCATSVSAPFTPASDRFHPRIPSDPPLSTSVFCKSRHYCYRPPRLRFAPINRAPTLYRDGPLLTQDARVRSPYIATAASSTPVHTLEMQTEVALPSLPLSVPPAGSKPIESLAGMEHAHGFTPQKLPFRYSWSYWFAHKWIIKLRWHESNWPQCTGNEWTSYVL